MPEAAVTIAQGRRLAGTAVVLDVATAAPGEERPALDQCLMDAQDSGLKPFQRTARTLAKWQKEVLNYWRYPLTNAMVEGKHNRVKVLKRRAYGYRNDRTFSLRILNLFHT